VTILDMTEFLKRKQTKAPEPAEAPSGRREDGTVLLGVFPGPGRQLQVLSHVCGYLAQPEGDTGPLHRAVILTDGTAYHKVCEALGGTYTSIYGPIGEAVERFGNALLNVYDFSQVKEPITEVLPHLTFGLPNTLLVIDGASGMLARYPRVFGLTTRYAKAGSGVMVMGETQDEVRSFEMAHKNVLLLLPEDA
jgi:hypothetical protein